MENKEYKLINGDNKEYYSQEKGTLGGNKSLKIYGKLDCASALFWINKGFYVKNRVFFASEEDAISAGYRPCARCMKKEYQIWKASKM